MKLYKSEKNIIVNFEKKFYHLQDLDWDLFINDDNLYSKARSLISKSNKISDKLLAKIDPPIESQELWASGVTYFISKKERQEESEDSGGAQFYEKVYNADRPELFFKATKNRIVGHKGNVRIRKDSNWNVPEPEFTLFITSNKKIVGYTIGNDMSSRDIEGENPLYLPQAKTYDGCASIGPSIYVIDKPISKDLSISMKITRNDSVVFQETISLNKMKRDPEELVEYLYRECSFPNGCFLMTGTGIVPPNNFSLQINDIINIRIENIGELINIVK